MNPMGELHTLVPLVFEDISSYSYVITATEVATVTGDVIPDPHSVTASINVSVTDQNDHIPEFTQASYHSNVPETRWTSEPILQVILRNSVSG